MSPGASQGFWHTETAARRAGVRKTVNSHRSLNRGGCSCILSCYVIIWKRTDLQNRNLWRCLMLLAIHLVMIMVFVILGVIFLNGKGAFLIAGYNTTSKAEKQKTDEKKLCSFMGKMMFILAGCWLVIASSEIFKAMWLLWVGLCLFFVVCVGAVIYMNSGNRFKR